MTRFFLALCALVLTATAQAQLNLEVAAGSFR
jgi:hypothetical protein